MILQDIETMTDAEKLALVKAIQENVASSKAKQVSLETGQYAKLVVDAIKKIKTDLEERYAEISGDIAVKSAAIKDGKDGINGAKGEKGATGLRGLDGANGKDGKDGKDGIDGSNGNGVLDARIDFDGSLIITLDNGNEINAGEVVPLDVAEKIKVVSNGGGTSQYVLDAIADLQTQISAISGGLSYRGTWNASTNTPALTSSTGTSNYYYVVSVSGSTNLNGITDWVAGDWAIYNGTAWQKIDQTNLVTSVNGQTGAVSLTAANVGAVGSIASADGSVTVTTVGSAVDLSVSIDSPASTVLAQVRNTTGSTLTKGTAVYISGATGQIPTVSKAIATGDSTSAQTLGLMTSDLANNSNGYVTIIGLVTEIDTSAYTDGAQLYLSGTTAGTLTATKTYAPTHLVYMAVVEYAHAIHGKLFVKVQNGYELDEIHNVSAQSPSNGQTIIYNATTSLWEKATLTAGTGISVTNGAGSISLAIDSTVTTLTGTQTLTNKTLTSPTLTTPALGTPASGNFSTGTFTWPTFNQNTTGTASNVTGTVAVLTGGTGSTTASGARTNLGLVIGTDVLAPTGSAASLTSFPTFNQNTTGSAGSLATTNFSVVQSGTKLLFKYGATTIASMDSTGIITSVTNIVSNGTP